MFADRGLWTTDHRDIIGRTIIIPGVIIRDVHIIVRIASVTFTAAIGGKMKVSELKEGMLLRFKEPRLYRFLRDSGEDHWFDCGLFDQSMRVQGTIGRPLMIYLGQEKMDAPSHYGGFWNVRKVSVEGRVGWVFPDAWKSMEAV